MPNKAIKSDAIDSAWLRHFMRKRCHAIAPFMARLYAREHEIDCSENFGSIVSEVVDRLTKSVSVNAR